MTDKNQIANDVIPIKWFPEIEPTKSKNVMHFKCLSKLGLVARDLVLLGRSPQLYIAYSFTGGLHPYHNTSCKLFADYVLVGVRKVSVAEKIVLTNSKEYTAEERDSLRDYFEHQVKEA